MLKKHHVFNIHCQMENWGQQLNMRLQMVSEQMSQIGPTGLADSLLFVSQLQAELNAIEKAHFDNSTSGQLCQVWPLSQFYSVCFLPAAQRHGHVVVMLLLLGDRRTLEVVRYGKNTIFTQFLLQKDTRIELVPYLIFASFCLTVWSWSSKPVAATMSSSMCFRTKAPTGCSLTRYC